MPGQNPTNDHWRRLATELGLEMEPAPIETIEERPEPVLEPPPTDQFVAANELNDEVPPGRFDEEPQFQVELPPPLPEPREPVAEDAEGEEEPRRRRRRGRRKKSDAPQATSSDPESETEDEAEDATAQIVKDWDIPSWNDLIASLYRPER